MAANGQLVTRADLSQFLANDQEIRTRIQLVQNLIDRKRDIYKECQYPRTVSAAMYKEMYDREGPAERVVAIYPDECWAVDPEIYETEEASLTPFEEDWLNLLANEELNPLHYLHRVDVLSGIGRFGVLHIGLDDGSSLERSAPGLDRDGLPDGTNPQLKLLYLRAYDESLVEVAEIESRINSPRYGKPVFYNITNQDPRSKSVGKTRVHWSRVLHVAEQLESNEIYAKPRMEAVFNRLLDLRKVYGGAAEMFWKGGFPGISIEALPEMILAGATFDKDAVTEEVYNYMNGLQRHLGLIGMTAKSLAPNIADPEKHVMVLLNAIAMAKGVPLRIFLGSEQAQLASGQDVRTWNRRLMKRQKRYITPRMLLALCTRFIAFGIVRSNQQPLKVFWPEINVPDQSEQAKIADNMMAALSKYMTSAGFQVIPPKRFLTLYLGLTTDQADVVIADLEKEQTKLKTPAELQAAVAGPRTTLGNGPQGGAITNIEVPAPPMPTVNITIPPTPEIPPAVVNVNVPNLPSPEIVVNVPPSPAPEVQVVNTLPDPSERGRRVTRRVKRDANGLIESIIEEVQENGEESPSV